jgi:hypothetical protein
MAKYKAVLFAPDGDWVTDYSNSESIEEVQELLANQGSRWFFYPFHAVIRDNGRGYTTKTQRIVDAAEPFEYLTGRTINTFAKEIDGLPNDTLAAILG